MLRKFEKLKINELNCSVLLQNYRSKSMCLLVSLLIWRVTKHKLEKISLMLFLYPKFLWQHHSLTQARTPHMHTHTHVHMHLLASCGHPWDLTTRPTWKPGLRHLIKKHHWVVILEGGQRLWAQLGLPDQHSRRRSHLLAGGKTGSVRLSFRCHDHHTASGTQEQPAAQGILNFLMARDHWSAGLLFWHLSILEKLPQTGHKWKLGLFLKGNFNAFSI